MKSAAITLSGPAWKKEAPDGLKKSGAGFQKALDEFAKAEAALDKDPSDGNAKAFSRALDAILAAGKAVASEAKDLEKKEKDKKLKTALANTQAAMGKPLAKEVSTARAKLDAAMKAAEEDDAGGLADPDAFTAYFLGHVSRLKKRRFNFALGMPSNVPEEMRLQFHATKGGKGLMSRLKADIKAKKTTWGRCGAETVFADLGDGGDPDDEGNPKARTLVLDVMGKQIPSLRRRVRLMLKKLGITQFNNVKILINGREVDADAAEDGLEDDAALEAVDLDAPDTDDETDETDEAPAGAEVEAEAATAATTAGGGAPDAAGEAGRRDRRATLEALEREADALLAELA